MGGDKCSVVFCCREGGYVCSTSSSTADGLLSGDEFIRAENVRMPSPLAWEEAMLCWRGRRLCSLEAEVFVWRTDLVSGNYEKCSRTGIMSLLGRRGPLRVRATRFFFSDSKRKSTQRGFFMNKRFLKCRRRTDFPI